jgi:hypothetical protein
MQDDGDHPRMGRTDWWLLAGSLVAFGVALVRLVTG